MTNAYSYKIKLVEEISSYWEKENYKYAHIPVDMSLSNGQKKKDIIDRKRETER